MKEDNKYTPYKEDLIHDSDYLIKISDIALNSHLWEDADIYKIQSQVWSLMQKQARLYTMGDSTSIPLETAEELKKSIYFCISTFLKSHGNVSENILLLKNTDLVNIFEQGQKEVLKLAEEGLMLLKAVNASALDIDNISYIDTIDALSSFFKLYDVKLMAHDIPCMIDYQLLSPIPELNGIDYINLYLHCLLIENTFCGKFSADKIKLLLNSAKIDVKKDLINISEYVLNNAIGLSMLNKNFYDLDINEYDKVKLQNLAGDCDKVTISQKTIHSLKDILSKLELDGYHYFENAALALSERMEALKNTDFNNLFISFDNTVNIENPIKFIEGKAMDDEELRLLIDRIKSCKDLSDKILIVKHSVKNIKDLAEILDACFWDKELNAIFETFNDLEISLLFSYVNKRYDMDCQSQLPLWVKSLAAYKKDSTI